MTSESIPSNTNSIKKCAIEDCQNYGNLSKGWCKPHYDAWYRTGNPINYKGDRSHLTVWEKVQEIGWTKTDSGCLEYNGYRNENGYGQFRDNTTNKLIRVHRLVYQQLVGELLPHEVIMHKCDNPPCCNPNHLRKGTQAENTRDMHNKGRNYEASLTHCPNGHLYPINRPMGIDKNRCRQCARDRNRRYHARKKGKIQ